MRVLVTGATGYVGGRLVPRLLDRGHAVRVLARDPRRIADLPFGDAVEVRRGDVLDPGTLTHVLEGIEAAYYLIHSMGSEGSFAERDRTGARNFAAAAQGVEHVVYLGGLLPDGARSEHLRSRAEVGAILRLSRPTTELRAGPVIGSGSASFEMVRYLTERLPAMIAPRWIRNAVQPIAIDDVLAYLVAALETGPAGVVEIGGADRLSFRRMMQVYAEVRGLERWIVPVPVLAPRLAARWVGLVTPVPNRLAVPLVEGIVQPVVARTGRARRLYPSIEPVDYRTAVGRALERTRAGAVRTRWSGALGGDEPYELDDWEGVVREERVVHVGAPAAALYRAFAELGGERGWLAWGWAWRLRGALDKLVGGPGLRRGRRDPAELATGEAVDFWRVEEVEPPRLLRLRAEMRLPGRAWLEWRAEPTAGGSRLRQTALFAPRGLGGALYWHALYPVHRIIFNRLARAIASEAERAAQPEP